MKRMINVIYNIAEETLSGDDIDRLISELETLKDYKLDEESKQSKKEEIERKSQEYTKKGFNF